MRHQHVGAMLLFLLVLLLGWSAPASGAPFAYISNHDSDTVSVVDTATNTVVATVPVGDRPYAVAVNGAGTRAYVTNLGSSTLSVLDTATNTVLATVPVGFYPSGVAVNLAGTRVYVANHYGNSVSVLDTATNTVLATVPVSSPGGLAVHPDGTRVYVTNMESGTLSVLDTATNTVVATVPVGTGPYGVAVDPFGTQVYVANHWSGTLSVLNTATNTVVDTVPVGTGPYGVAVDLSGSPVYVTNHWSGTLSVVEETEGGFAAATVPVGSLPTGVTAHPEGTRVYVANGGDGTVSVIDSATNAVLNTIQVGSFPIAFGQFIAPSFPLNVLKFGLGSGTVTSKPVGIDCGTTCAARFDGGASVSLAAAAGPSSVFTGWSGEGCTGTGDCTVSMTQLRFVFATFSPTFTLTVSKDVEGGDGSGTVTSSPGGINCDPTCTTQSAQYVAGTSVSLTPSAASGSNFGGWTGDCIGTGACTVSMTQDRSVAVVFNLSGPILTAPQTHTAGSTGAGSTTIQAPSAPAALQQFRPDGATAISTGGTVAKRTVLLVGTVNTPDPAKQVKLQIELQPLAAAFTGTPTHEGPLVPSGSTTSVLLSGLPYGGYHWRARTMDGLGLPSDWIAFGENTDTEADFTLAAPPAKVGMIQAGTWYLDKNGNGVWDGCEADQCSSFGAPGDTFVVGDWSGNGRDRIGVYRNGTWYLDANGNGAFDACDLDKCITWGGDPSDKVVVGDWNGDGRTKVGIYRAGTWYLDANGNGLWDGCEVDRCLAWGGESGDVPVLGDWNGDGKTKIGIYRNGVWYLDGNGNGLWDGCDVDRCLAWGGESGDAPVLGDWNGDGKTKIGVYRNGTWYLDANGNGLWDGCDVDRCLAWGDAGNSSSQMEVVGRW